MKWKELLEAKKEEETDIYVGKTMATKPFTTWNSISHFYKGIVLWDFSCFLSLQYDPYMQLTLCSTCFRASDGTKKVGGGPNFDEILARLYREFKKIK